MAHMPKQTLPVSILPPEEQRRVHRKAINTQFPWFQEVQPRGQCVTAKVDQRGFIIGSVRL